MSDLKESDIDDVLASIYKVGQDLDKRPWIARPSEYYRDGLDFYDADGKFKCAAGPTFIEAIKDFRKKKQ